jgi:hypothetical protein
MSQPTWQSSRRGCILLLLAFCIGYPLWLISIEFAARQWYFHPLCQGYADQRALDLIAYQRGGRGSPPSCALSGATVPIAEIAGTTATAVYIGTDILAVLIPFLVPIILGGIWSAQDRRRRRGPR